MTGKNNRPATSGRDNRDPSFLVWLLASVSLVLPWIGIVLVLVGGYRLGRDAMLGAALIAAGIALIILDVVIDFVWADPVIWTSDEPDLNRRGRELIGRTALVTDAIAAGRGKVQVGDTVWLAEGPDLATGTRVKIVGTTGTRLIVDPA